MHLSESTCHAPVQKYPSEKASNFLGCRRRRKSSLAVGDDNEFIIDNYVQVDFHLVLDTRTSKTHVHDRDLPGSAENDDSGHDHRMNRKREDCLQEPA